MTLTPPLATVGIVSIGDMGLGIAKLLSAHNYRVLTNVSGRRSADILATPLPLSLLKTTASESTRQRAQSASIELVDTDHDLVAQADYILSILPPRDAVNTAKRFSEAVAAHVRDPDQGPLYYLDLNAISPSRARTVEALLETYSHVRFIDGGVSE